MGSSKSTSLCAFPAFGVRLFIYRLEDYWASLAISLFVLIFGYVYSAVDWSLWCAEDYSSLSIITSNQFYNSFYLVFNPVAVVVLWHSLLRCHEIESFIRNVRSRVDLDEVEETGDGGGGNSYGAIPLLLETIGVPMGSFQQGRLNKSNYSDEQAVKDLFYQKVSFLFAGYMQLLFFIWGVCLLTVNDTTDYNSCLEGTGIYIWTIIAVFASFCDFVVAVCFNSSLCVSDTFIWNKLIGEMYRLRPDLESRDDLGAAWCDFFSGRRVYYECCGKPANKV